MSVFYTMKIKGPLCGCFNVLQWQYVFLVCACVCVCVCVCVCFLQNKKSYRFGTIWGWENGNIILILGTFITPLWTIMNTFIIIFMKQYKQLQKGHSDLLRYRTWFVFWESVLLAIMFSNYICLNDHNFFLVTLYLKVSLVQRNCILKYWVILINRMYL